MSASQQQGPPGWPRVLLDLAAFTLPWIVIFKQAGIGFSPPGEVSEPLLWLAGAMLGVPGVSQVLAFKFGGGTGTDERPRQDRSPDLPSSGPSSVASGVEV